MVRNVIIVRQFIFIQYTMNLNLLMCVTQFISTPTACTHIINYGLLKRDIKIKQFWTKIVRKFLLIFYVNSYVRS